MERTPIAHGKIAANGGAFHVARVGAGAPLLLLHGWPEFWLTWEKGMQRPAPAPALVGATRGSCAAYIGETFSDLDFSLFPGVGHFPHREDPDRAAAEIASFFARIGWR